MVTTRVYVFALEELSECNFVFILQTKLSDDQCCYTPCLLICYVSLLVFNDVDHGSILVCMFV